MLHDLPAPTLGDLLCTLTTLNARYAQAIDNDELEGWPNLFVDDGRYEIIPRESEAVGTPVALMVCEGTSMMRERVAAIRRANVFGPHIYRHIIGMSVVLEHDAASVRTSTNFALFQTLLDPIHNGKTITYAVGEYRDVVELGATPRFIERIVVTDTAKIPAVLATPI